MIDQQKINEDGQQAARKQGYDDACIIEGTLREGARDFCSSFSVKPSEYLLNALRDLACASHPDKAEYLEGWQKRMEENAA